MLFALNVYSLEGVTPPRPSRTQAERRASTQRAILDAAVETLLEVGYAKTTTSEISRRAGVSHGILFRYWPTKGQLLAAASSRLFEILTAALDREKVGFTSDLSTDHMIALLWDILQSPQQQARTELLVAARTDADLAAAMDEHEAHHTATILSMARELFPELAETRDDFDQLVLGVLVSLQGASLLAAARPQVAEGIRAIWLHNTRLLF